LLTALLISSGESAADVAHGHVFHDENGNGVFDDGEPGVEGVSISNGHEVVATGAEGLYELPVTDDSILFVIKPPGQYQVTRCYRR
jgi:hypothetical protein